MATLNLKNPTGYDGQPGTQYKQGIVRLATDTEAAAGTANNVVITPVQLTAGVGSNFASPPLLGFGSTTPRPVSATNILSTSAIVAGSTLNATLGNITATNGNIVRGTAGNKDVYTSVATTITAGANSAGTVTLVAGQAVISTTAVTAGSIIRLYRQEIGSTGAAALGAITVLSRVAGTSFTIRAVQAADSTLAQASDVSVIAWEIVN